MEDPKNLDEKESSSRDKLLDLNHSVESSHQEEGELQLSTNTDSKLEENDNVGIASISNTSGKRNHSLVDEEKRGIEAHPSKFIKLKCSDSSTENLIQKKLVATSVEMCDSEGCSEQMNGKDCQTDDIESLSTDQLQKEAGGSKIRDCEEKIQSDENRNSELSTNVNTDSSTDETRNVNDTSLPSSSGTSSSNSSDPKVCPENRSQKYRNLSDCSEDGDNNNNDLTGSNNDSESDSSSCTSGLSSDEEKDDFDLVSWNIGLHVPFTEDSESSSDELNAGSGVEKVPNVLKKSLPAQKLFLPREIMNRQFRGDDPRCRRSMKFENKVYGSRRMVQRLELFESLNKHNGCVNSVSFNESGNILISASDDRHVCLWDWSRNKSLLFFDSGHKANVFQAKFLPCSGDTHLITCGQDNQIRMCLLDQCGLKSTRSIISHERPVHKLALRRQMPNTFLSAGEDGVVYSVDIRESSSYCSKLLEIRGTRSNLNPVCLYSIHCNPLKNYEFIVCGNDKDVRLFDQRRISSTSASPVETFCPWALPNTNDITFQGKYMKSVTCAVFNYNGTEILASYNDNDIYLFDAYTTKDVHHYDGHRNFATIKGVNFYGPRSDYVVSGSDCGYIYIWDKNSEAIVQWMKGDDNIVNCLEPHPSFPILATSGLDSDVKVWMPLSEDVKNIRDSSEFQKVTKKNNFYKYANFSRYPSRSLVVRSIFDADDLGNELAQTRLPIILSYRRALAIRQRRLQSNSNWSSDEPENDDDERSSDSLD